MADFKYFNDTHGSEPIELVGLQLIENKKFAERWPGVKGIRDGTFARRAATSQEHGLLPVTRMIEMKRQPSRHKCDARCLGGKINGACECQCKGQNHGRGMFTALIS